MVFTWLASRDRKLCEQKGGKRERDRAHLFVLLSVQKIGFFQFFLEKKSTFEVKMDYLFVIFLKN